MFPLEGLVIGVKSLVDDENPAVLAYHFHQHCDALRGRLGEPARRFIIDMTRETKARFCWLSTGTRNEERTTVSSQKDSQYIVRSRPRGFNPA